jgi:hypothetical protein
MNLFETYAKHAKRVVTLHPTFVRTLRIAELGHSWALQTELLDEEGITILETLFTYDGKTASLLERERTGHAHDDMRSYPRDAEFPIGCIVRLTHA